MPSFPTRQQAQFLFEEIVAERNASEHPFQPGWEKEYRSHCAAVARIAETIAVKTPYLNSEKAYVFGLLHDSGKYIDEYALNYFHGLSGYQRMMRKGYPELARISLTHTFYKKDFELDDYPFSKPDLIKCRELLKKIEYNDYDLLLQLADMINDMGTTCTLEYRTDSVCRRRNIAPQNYRWVLLRLNEIKNYFDEQCGCDIYSLFNLTR